MSNKKIKNKHFQRIKAEVDKEKAALQQQKNKLRPFVDFLKKKSLRFNHARVGNSRIDYFRIDEFQKILTQNQDQIEANQQLRSIVKQLNIYLNYFKRPAHIKAKYPDLLQPVTHDSQQKKYACFRFDITESKKWMMFGIIFSILFLVLFPIWPYELKYGIWLTSFCLLIFLLGLIVLRLAIFIICIIFGYNVWIFPNLFSEQGFFDSFKPLFYSQKWEKNWYNTLIRVFVVSSLIAYGCYLYLNPTIFYEKIEITKQTAQDIHDWGVEKIKNQKNFSQRAITNLEHILNQTADVKQQSGDNKYTNLNENFDNQL